MNKQILILLIIGLLCGCGQDEPNNMDTSAPLFSLVDKSHSQLEFSNNLHVDLSSKYNLLDYDYFYNGAGVGIADINNDGLDDIFLTGNMEPNKLYLNKGDLRFEDISESAGINVNKQWSNGVTFADVNQDGWLDIYISQGGPEGSEKRKNLLYINQQNGSFNEQASSFGLDDRGISTQSAFMDFDMDGDLDCIVMNESVLYGFDPVSFLQRIASDKEANELSLSNLYRNDNGVFKNVSIESGISKPTFGLGLLVSDLNDDLLPDIYIANDYYLPDAMYINQGDGTFKDEIKQRTQQVSMFGMGVDSEDLNQDGKQDLFVLDMAAADHIRSKTLMASMNVSDFNMLVKKFRFQYQYMFNSLQINDGNNRYKNLSQLAGVAKTDWSWAGLIADFDLDGMKDIFVTNGYRRYGLDNDFKIRVNKAKQSYQGNVPLAIKEELYNSMPEGKLPNIMYQNLGDLQLKDVSDTWGFEAATYSNGAGFSDLDNDGDLDLVINNIDQQVLLYKNNASEKADAHFLKVKTVGRTSEDVAKVTVTFTDGSSQTAESKRVRGYRSAVSPIAHFGFDKKKKIQRVHAVWSDGLNISRTDVDANISIEMSYENAEENRTTSTDQNRPFATVNNGKYKLNYVHRENSYDDFDKEILLPVRQSTLGPVISKADFNNDGLEDLFVGGAAGYAANIFLQTNAGFEQLSNDVLERDKDFEDLGSAWIDVDTDGDLDLFVCSGGNQYAADNDLYTNRLYLNNGSGKFSKSDQPVLAESKVQSFKALPVDLDNDGSFELFVANRIQAQQYPVHAPSIIYRFKNGIMEDVTDSWAPDLHDFGIVNDVIASDIDNDGDTDILVVGEWTGIGIFKNTENGLEYNRDLSDKTGWWFSITETDVNKDNKPDFILGNLGLNSKYKASADKPFKIFADDFDENGTSDIVLSNKYKDEYVPLRGRECSSQQMPFIAEKFPSYKGFANASLIDIFGDKIVSAYEREVTDFKSHLLLNTGSGFELIPLPMAAQEFPILACISKDINDDSYPDLILSGNIYQTEVETPRLDSGKGLVLVSNQKDGYGVLPFDRSGLAIPGDSKSMVDIQHATGAELIIVGKNQSLLQIVELSL